MTISEDLCEEKHANINTQITDIKTWLQNLEKKYNAMIFLLVGNLAGVIGLLLQSFMK